MCIRDRFERARQEQQLLEMLNSQRTPQGDTGLLRSAGNQYDRTPEPTMQQRQTGAPDHQAFGVSQSLAGNAVATTRDWYATLRSAGYDQHRLEPSAQQFPNVHGASLQHAHQFDLLPSEPAGLPSSRPTIVSSQGIQSNREVFPGPQETRRKNDTERAVGSGGSKKETNQGDDKSDTPR